VTLDTPLGVIYHAWTRTRGRKGMHLLSDLIKGKCAALKRIGEDRKMWQKFKIANILL